MADFDPEIDYYEMLQVHPRAHAEVIKRAYHTILRMLKTHPDLGGRHEDAVRINEAYAILSDNDLRQRYDAARAARQHTATPPPAPPPSAGRAATQDRGASPRSPYPRIVYCPRCGARNRLAFGMNAFFSICGKCRTSLANGHRLQHAPILNLPPVNLTPALTQRLETRGEVRLTRTHMPANHQLNCLRCGHHWQSATEKLPERCPRCHSRHWGNFRAFLCRCCGHRFSIVDLYSWPYRLFLYCPACHQPHWHTGCERRPLRWLIERLFG